MPMDIKWLIITSKLVPQTLAQDSFKKGVISLVKISLNDSFASKHNLKIFIVQSNFVNETALSNH